MLSSIRVKKKYICKHSQRDHRAVRALFAKSSSTVNCGNQNAAHTLRHYANLYHVYNVCVCRTFAQQVESLFHCRRRERARVAFNFNSVSGCVSVCVCDVRVCLRLAHAHTAHIPKQNSWNRNTRLSARFRSRGTCARLIRVVVCVLLCQCLAKSPAQQYRALEAWPGHIRPSRAHKLHRISMIIYFTLIIEHNQQAFTHTILTNCVSSGVCLHACSWRIVSRQRHPNSKIQHSTPHNSTPHPHAKRSDEELASSTTENVYTVQCKHAAAGRSMSVKHAHVRVFISL